MHALAKIAASLVLAWHGGPAHHHRYPQHWAERGMVVAAAAYWHQQPACGRPRLVRVATIGPDLPMIQPDSWAYVPERDPGACTIYLVRRYWHADIEQADFGAACRLMTHEYAHLLGMWDVPQPDTMLSHAVDETLPDAPCDRVAKLVLT